MKNISEKRIKETLIENSKNHTPYLWNEISCKLEPEKNRIYSNSQIQRLIFRHYLIAIPVICVMSIVLISLSVFFMDNHLLKTNKNIFASMAYYTSSKELVKCSDNIIIGEVESVGKPFYTSLKDYIKPSSAINSEILKSKDEHIRSQVKVIKSLKGNLKTGDVIPVLQSGIVNEGNIMVIPSAKELNSNEQYIFFLRYTVPDTEQSKKDYKIPLYVILNPFQGQIKITNNKIDIDDYELPMFNGLRTISEVEKIISKVIKELNNK